MSDTLTAAVVHAAEHAPIAALLAGAAAVERDARWTPGSRRRLLGADAGADYALHLKPVAKAWEANPDLPGVAIAAALRAAGAAVADQQSDNKVSLVWTGPLTEEIGLRRTRSVLHTLVEQATESLVLVSYAGMKVDEVVARLNKAIDRGVDVVLILGTKIDGDVNVDAAAAFSKLDERAKFYRWPRELREANYANNAKLHAKCVIRDGVEVLITSANLTGAGINDNMECGVLISAGPVPASLHRHFRLLIEDETLVRV